MSISKNKPLSLAKVNNNSDSEPTMISSKQQNETEEQTKQTKPLSF